MIEILIDLVLIIFFIELLFKPRIDFHKDQITLWYTTLEVGSVRKYMILWKNN